MIQNYIKIRIFHKYCPICCNWNEYGYHKLIICSLGSVSISKLSALPMLAGIILPQRASGSQHRSYSNFLSLLLLWVVVYPFIFLQLVYLSSHSFSWLRGGIYLPISAALTSKKFKLLVILLDFYLLSIVAEKMGEQGWRFIAPAHHHSHCSQCIPIFEQFVPHSVHRSGLWQSHADMLS